MAWEAHIRGWLELGYEESRKLATLLKTEKLKCEKEDPFLFTALNCWILPDVDSPHGFFAFFGTVVNQSRIDYFRELFGRIAAEVWDDDGSLEKYYAFGIFHVNTEDGRAFRWRLRHGQFEELPESDIECGMG